MEEFKPWTRILVETREDDQRQNYEFHIVIEDNEDCKEKIEEVIRENQLRPIYHTEMYADDNVLCEAIYLRITKEKANVKIDDGQSIMEIVEEYTTVCFEEKKSVTKAPTKT